MKKRLAPSFEVCSLEIELKYHRLCKGQGAQNVDTWLDEWVITYKEAKEHDVAEVTGTRPVRDFLMAIRSAELTFADAHLLMRNHSKADDLIELVEDFRQQVRLHQLYHRKEETHSASTTDSNTTMNSIKTSFRGQQMPPNPCVCGDTHLLADCPYLAREKRTQEWNVNSAKQLKVDKALRNDRTRARVERTLQKRKDKESRLSEGASASTSTNSSANTAYELLVAGEGGAFPVQTALAATTYHLQGSWILNSRPDTHVCNSTMVSRFTTTHIAGPEDRLTAGD